MGKGVRVKVTAKEHKGNVERMIRRFIKKCKRERIIEEARDRRAYKKPSEAKKEKRIRAAHQRFRDEQKRRRAKERRNRKI